MSYNVRYFGHALRGAGSTRGALRSIARAIAELESPPDLICLQEVETRSLRTRLCHTPGKSDETQLDLLLDLLRQHGASYEGHYFPAHTYRIGKAVMYTTGLAILSAEGVELSDHNAAAPRDITHRRLRRTAPLKQSRICAHARFRDRSGNELDVFNTHLSLPAFATKKFLARSEGRMGYGDNQRAEVMRLAEFVNEARSSNRFLVVGDFNSLPASPAYNLLIERLGVVDPFSALLGYEPRVMRVAWPTAGFLNLRMRLDHIFIGPDIECLDFADSHPYGVAGPWHGLSDHVPLLGRFRTQ